jgi:hypothetical protein
VTIIASLEAMATSRVEAKYGTVQAAPHPAWSLLHGAALQGGHLSALIVPTKMASTPLHLVPPTYTGGAAQQSPQDTSPAGSITGTSGTAQILLERTEIDKSLKALENVVSVLYDYAQLWQSVVSLDKKLVSLIAAISSLCEY